MARADRTQYMLGTRIHDATIPIAAQQASDCMQATKEPLWWTLIV